MAVCVREVSVPVRRVGNMFYDQSFGEKPPRNLLLNGTRNGQNTNSLQFEKLFGVLLPQEL